MNEFIWNGKKISFLEQGKGFPVVLLHGYLESKEIWNDFAKRLAINYRVIIPDIPGHGDSEIIAETHSMKLMAQAIHALLQFLSIKKCVLVGHSMGGYVMLAFAQLFPENLDGMVLFHSSVYADTEEKKKSRLQEIVLIEKGYLDQIVANHLPKTFASDNLHRFPPILNETNQRALKHDAKGVCALLRGLMERTDQQELIRNFEKPLLFIFGKKDQFISGDAAEKMVQLNSNIQVMWLFNSGHMGFIEEPDEVAVTMQGFLNNFKLL
jgi:pimeloyl-ACP methyl ester carboxylesterase